MSPFFKPFGDGGYFEKSNYETVYVYKEQMFHVKQSSISIEITGKN